jgi:gamma-glutamylcyclotransferase (GGCT)/AIG2-like uncharacterized protein YtfP
MVASRHGMIPRVIDDFGGEQLDLFVYGTLMVPEVMREASGFQGSGIPAVLPDHRCRLVRGEVYPAVCPHAGDSVEGLVYRGLTVEQLSLLDTFEGEFYERHTVRIVCGTSHLPAETYILAPRHRARLSDLAWSLEWFLREGITRFTTEYRGFARAAGSRQDHE